MPGDSAKLLVCYTKFMITYKNISGQDLTIPGVGVVKAGENVELPETFINANFERVSKSQAKREKVLKDES